MSKAYQEVYLGRHTHQPADLPKISQIEIPLSAVSATETHFDGTSQAAYNLWISPCSECLERKIGEAAALAASLRLIRYVDTPNSDPKYGLRDNAQDQSYRIDFDDTNFLSLTRQSLPSDAPWAQYVSRRAHAELSVNSEPAGGQVLTVRDMGSLNGTTVRFDYEAHDPRTVPFY